MPYGERPPVTSKISTQRVSSAKSIYHAIPAFQVCIFWKDQSHITVKTYGRPRIMSHWQLYCLFSSAYRKNARMHQISTPLFSYEDNPPVTTGIIPEGASNAKSIIHAVPEQLIYHWFIIIMEKKSTTVTSHEHQGISHHWQFYCLFNSPYTKTLKSRKKSHKAPLYWSPVGRFHRQPTETQRKGPSIQKIVRHTISGLHLFHQYYVKLNKFSTTYHVHYWSFMRIHWWPMDSPHQGPTKRKALMCNSRSIFASSILCNIKQNFHHSDVICAWWASSSLATLLFVHQPLHRNTTENNKALHYWFLVGRDQPRTMESPHKGPATRKAKAISIFQVYIWWKDTFYTTVEAHARPGIPSNWQFYCLFNNT